MGLWFLLLLPLVSSNFKVRLTRCHKKIGNYTNAIEDQLVYATPTNLASFTNVKLGRDSTAALSSSALSENNAQKGT